MLEAILGLLVVLVVLVAAAPTARAESCSPGCGDVLCRDLDTVEVKVVAVGASELQVEVMALDRPRGDLAVGDRLPMFTFIAAGMNDRLLATVGEGRAFGIARIIDVGGCRR